MHCKRIVLIVNWLELFVQEVDSESFESVDSRGLKTFSWNAGLFLLPVISQEMQPPCLRKNHKTFETSLGICPSVTPSPLTVIFVTFTVYTVTCYLHANISWSCQPLALDWIQRKIISDGLALN